MKKIASKIILVSIMILLFFAGRYVGIHTSEKQNRTFVHNFSLETYNMIKYNFGQVDENDTIIGYIPFYKDLGFAIVLNTNIRTIKAY